MYKNAIILVSGLILELGMPSAAIADTIASEYQLDALLPRAEGLDTLKQKIKANPEDKENYYAYARLASVLGKPDQVAWAYERVLVLDPGLDRVRLDLSLVYIGLGRLDDARGLLTIVLNKNPPDSVQKNIRAVLAKIDEAQRRHHFSGSVTLGVASDSNANAAPNSGNIEVLNTIVPLGEGARSQKDLQAFAAATLSHVYDIEHKTNMYAYRWQSSAVTYKTLQNELGNLSLHVMGVRSGPEIIYLPLDIHVSVLGGYNFLTLDEQSYLRNPSVEIKADFPLIGDVRGWLNSSLEYRYYSNADQIRTYIDRNGRAVQTQFGLRYPFAERSLWESAFTLRREHAKKDYYANTQAGVMLSNTYAFSSEIAGGRLTDVFTIIRGGYKESVYDNPDTLISTQRRDDKEFNGQFTLGRKLPHDITLTGSYAYTNDLSNLENYRYSNHRFALSVSKGF